MFPAGFITLSDVYLAYKKAKVEAFYDRSHPSCLRFTKFEQNLRANIECIFNILNNGQVAWWTESELIGEYLYIPKSIDDRKWDGNDNVHYRSVDPDVDWVQRFKQSDSQRLEAKYRLIIVPTVEYQIISALWIIKVGHVLEERINRKLSYGNLLRRKFGKARGVANGPVNLDSAGLFVPYFSAYRDWRKKGLDAMRGLLDHGKSVTAITMDLANFYHNVSPKFVLRSSFIERMGVELSSEQRKFTRLLVDSIYTWYEGTPDYDDRVDGALPVGISTSKILSNILLCELDDEIQEKIAPAYYGRYVDDIFLVFETPDGLGSGNTIIEYLAREVDCLKIKKVAGIAPSLTVRLKYAHDSELVFSSSKQKIFSLSSEHGHDLINQITAQIRSQSSEYRMLPQVPRTANEMADRALLASSDASLIADALRKADVVSIRRLGLSLLLSDIEQYSINLQRAEWVEVRKEFYGLCKRYLVSPKGLFEYFGYYSRIVRLMVSNYDFADVGEFIEKIDSCFETVLKTTLVEKGRTARIKACKRYFCRVLLQSVLQASTARKFSEWEKLRKLNLKIQKIFDESVEVKTKSELKLLSFQILMADLGARAYKDYWYYSQKEDISLVSVPKSTNVRRVLRLASLRSFRKAAELKVAHWPALVFPTRPLSIQEIVLICPAVLSEGKLFVRAIYGLRGARTMSSSFVSKRSSVEDGYVVESHWRKDRREKITIGLTNFETTGAQFESALLGKPDRSLERYERINKLTNDILRNQKRLDYVVFPECAIPLRWAIGVAQKLSTQSVSLLAGVEYFEYRKKKNTVRNSCLISLVSYWPGYPSSIVVLQDKLIPSHGEALKLKAARKKQYQSAKPLEESLPLYRHGEFQFGVLLCSDLTNPECRVRYQGKVDCLFVLEWNPDVKTFSFLIEGAAHDIHTFVVQANNRKYGDSRIRAPYRVSFKRDSVRVKGGLDDFYVIGEVDFRSLRMFQNKGSMVDKQSEFKPVPIGFKVSRSRK